jgi:hypothetical protein
MGTQDVATPIITLLLPNGDKADKHLEGISVDDLPQALWTETNDHVRAIFHRVGDSREYEFIRRASRGDAQAEGIPCF